MIEFERNSHTVRRRLGPTSVSVDVLCLGLSPLGNLYRALSDDDAHATLQAWWDLGLRTFDVAPVYGFGIAERRLGAFLAGKPRDEYVVCTKVGRLLVEGAPLAREFLMPDGTPQWRDVPAAVQPVYDFSAAGVQRSLEASLERLGLDRVDCVHIHDPDLHLAQAANEAYPALAALRDQGVVGALGVAANSERVALPIVRSCDLDCVLIAGRCTLLVREAADELLPLCAARGTAVLAAGVFHGGFLADPRPGAMFQYRPTSDVGLLARVDAIRRVCEDHGVTLKAAALQYPLRHDAVTAVVVGASSPDEAAECVDLFGGPIPAAVWDELEEEGTIVR